MRERRAVGTSITLDKTVLQALNEYAEQTLLKKSTVTSLALVEYLKARGVAIEQN
ncbi:MAG: hypothetical protein KME18_07580 [Phormidium tanganyikae FI6-MK23]|jgi:predicted transcriptional regulator|nr:hypothetical protein [Phormidium tanganyikae FI6-MK23]